MDIALTDLWLFEKVPGFSNEGREYLGVEATDFLRRPRSPTHRQ
jgi:hypothetical protein